VNVLDENIRADQRDLLHTWRIPVRQIGYDLHDKGLSDENIVPLLLQLRNPTLFTGDRDFVRRFLCHPRYCLVRLAVGKQEAASYIRRLLRHPNFDTQAKRMGSVLRVAPIGIAIWRLHAEAEAHIPWPGRGGRAQRPAAR
jgi:hypothetical protein